MEQVIITVLIYIKAPHSIMVAGKFSHQEKTQEAFQIQLATIALIRMRITGRPQKGLHLVECIADVRELFRSDILIIGIFHIHGNPTYVTAEVILLTARTGNLKQVAASNAVFLVILR